tara:strand:- start:2311 stop:3702 length:1392 start_codon:yes stop_codon:yes gene_type:complete
MSEDLLNLNQTADDAEMVLLGGLMLETERFDTVVLKINHHDFQNERHQLIFESMGELVNENKPLDPITLSEDLDNKNKLQFIGGKEYLVSLAKGVPSAAPLDHYAEIIKQRSITRQLMQTNRGIEDLIKNPQGLDGQKLLDEAERRIFALNDEANNSQSNILSMKELVPQSIDRLQVLSESGSALIGASTGFKAMDKMLQGLQDGDLIVVAGRPSMGKTAFALNIAENVALNEENPGGVLFFSLEMSAEQLTTRLLAGMSRFNQQDIRSGRLDNQQLSYIFEQGNKLKKIPFFIDDSSLLSPMELRARARRVNRTEPNGLSLIVVDYLQLMQIPGSNENRVNQISEISRSLKSLARELNVPVIALSQLSRAVEQRGRDKKPMMSDLRDSGAIEQDADVIIFLYRDKQYNPDSEEGNKAEIIVGKQRNGPTGTVTLSFIEEFARFEDFISDHFKPDEDYSSQFE